MPNDLQTAVLAVNNSSSTNRLAPIPRHRVRFSLVLMYVAALGGWVPQTTERTVLGRGGGLDASAQATFADAGYNDTTIDADNIDISTAFSAGALSPNSDVLVLGLGVSLTKQPRILVPASGTYPTQVYAGTTPTAGAAASTATMIALTVPQAGLTMGNEEEQIVDALYSSYISGGVVMLVPYNGTTQCSAYLANTQMIPPGVGMRNSSTPVLGNGQPCDRYALKQPLYLRAPAGEGQQVVSSNRMKIKFFGLPAAIQNRINGVARTDGTLCVLDCALIIDYARVQVIAGSVANGDPTFQALTKADQEIIELFGHQV